MSKVIHQHIRGSKSQTQAYSTLWDSKFNCVFNKWEGFYHNVINYNSYPKEEYKMKFINDEQIELTHKTTHKEDYNEIELSYHL